MHSSSVEWDLVVVGAGPVGLMAANIAATAGLRTLVIEKERGRKTASRAIGIMAPSLDIFDDLGLRQAICDAGVTVNTARIHGYKQLLGSVEFDARHPVISLPQTQTETMLEQALSAQERVTLNRGVQVTGAVQSEDRVDLTTTTDSAEDAVSARFVLACDGDHGTLRGHFQPAGKAKKFKQAFLMGDFRDTSDLQTEAHLYFTPFGAVESFPLPDRMRRWIVQTRNYETTPTVSQVIARVSRRTGIALSPDDNIWLSPFGIKRRISRPYSNGRMILCGDAAHVMPPIGGQGMNTGFADAWMAVRIIEKAIEDKLPHGPLLAVYDRHRAIAAEAAAKRAVLSMTIGTIRGRALSALRNGIIALALRSRFLLERIPPHFAMQTIPFGTVAKMAPLLLNEPELQKTE